jgi:hypothetical protein
MALPLISPLPNPPSREDDSDAFVQAADAFVAALIPFVAQLNAAIVAIPAIASAINYNTTSTTSLTVGAGAKTFTVPAGGLLQIGQFVIAASLATPTSYMAGQVTGHNSTTGVLDVNVTTTGAAGTHADWVIAVTVADALQPVAMIALTGSGADLGDGTVTYAKIQNAGASKLIGGGSGGGVPRDIALGTNLSMSGNVLNASSGTATVGDGDYGEIVITSGVWTIDGKAVTYAKFQDLPGDSLFGNSSASSGTGGAIACTPVARTLIAQTTQALMRSAGLGLGSISPFAEATAADFWANTASKALSAQGAWAAAAPVTLTQATTIGVDLATGINFTTTMTGNRTLGNPTNTKNGQTGRIEILQDSTGNRTLAFGANWKAASGSLPVLSTAANAKDYLYYEVISSTFILIVGFVKGAA